LEYSKDYQYRVCVDISLVALQEARKRIGGHGLFVVADIANLPFKANAFDGAVSLHTIHHLPLEDHLTAYKELFRVLIPGSSVVNGWKNPAVERWVKVFRRITGKLWRKKQNTSDNHPLNAHQPPLDPSEGKTFVSKYDAAWFKEAVGGYLSYEIWVWRSVSVGIMRTYIHENRLGHWLLGLIFRLEELFPHYLGEKGVYPLIVIRKTNG
jgi:ubiquinone/menaquinone biosynthesis C-methylase UbiE